MVPVMGGSAPEGWEAQGVQAGLAAAQRRPEACAAALLGAAGLPAGSDPCWQASCGAWYMRRTVHTPPDLSTQAGSTSLPQPPLVRKLGRCSKAYLALALDWHVPSQATGKSRAKRGVAMPGSPVLLAQTRMAEGPMAARQELPGSQAAAPAVGLEWEAVQMGLAQEQLLLQLGQLAG